MGNETKLLPPPPEHDALAVEDMLPNAAQTLLLVFLWLAPTLGCFVLPHPPHLNPYALPLAALAVVTELRSRRVLTFGQVSSAPALYLVLALWAQASPALAVATASLAALARAFFRAGAPGIHLLEFFCTTFPVSCVAIFLGMTAGLEAPLAALASSGIYAGLLNYMPLVWGGRLGAEWDKDWRSWWNFQRAIVLLGAGLSFLAATAPWACLFALPLLLQPTRVEVGPGQLALKKATARLEKAQEALETSHNDRARIESQLTNKLEELCLVQELSTDLVQSNDLYRCCDQVLAAVQRITRASTVAYYGNEGGGGTLLPIRFLCAQPDRLQQFALLRLGEPIVDNCWQARQMVCQGSPSQVNRPHPHEQATVALSLGDFGVIYAGRVHPPFSQEECQLLRILQDQATVAFYACSRLVGLRQGLEQIHRAHRRARRWARRRARLLRVCGRIAGSLSSAQLGQELSRTIGRILPYRTIHVHWAPQNLNISNADSSLPLSALLQASQRSGRPLLIPDLSRFLSGLAGQQKAMLCPFREGKQWCGAILLVGEAQPPWRRAHLHLLGILALQLKATLRHLQMNEEISEAYSQLQSSQAQLMQSSKMAAVGQLAAGLAHEVNTPLAVIKMGVAAAAKLLDADQTKKAAARLEHARGAIGKAEGIIQRLLYYSKEGSVGSRPTELHVVAQDALTFLAHHASLEKVRLLPRLEAVPEILANPNELQQVVTNLLLNACDAVQELPPEQRNVEIITGLRDQRVGLMVRDNGCGIPEAIRDRIFEPFFTTKEVGKGSGLGLFVSLQIAQKYGGKLELLSPGPRGASFLLSFPL